MRRRQFLGVAMGGLVGVATEGLASAYEIIPIPDSKPSRDSREVDTDKSSLPEPSKDGIVARPGGVIEGYGNGCANLSYAGRKVVVGGLTENPRFENDKKDFSWCCAPSVDK